MRAFPVERADRELPSKDYKIESKEKHRTKGRVQREKKKYEQEVECKERRRNMSKSSSSIADPNSKRRRYPAPTTAALILGAFCVGYIMVTSPLHSENSIQRKLQAAEDPAAFLRPAAAANGVPQVNNGQANQNREQPPGDCRVLQGLPPLQKIDPTFAASYPGSGAKMSWNLITGLAGVQTADDHLLNGVQWNDAVTVKTHFPHPEGNQEIGKMMNYGVLKTTFPRVMIILRHPMNAIPGYHNYLYEAERGLPGHSTRAPLGEWIKWREAHFEEEMNRWIQHTAYWVDNYGSATGGMSLEGKVERQIISYEGMVSDAGEGPPNALALAKFLDVTDGVDGITKPAIVGCIWQKIIKYKGANGPPKAGTKDLESKRSGSTFRPYSLKQYDYMISQMEQLMTTHGEDRQLKPILESYIGWAQMERANRARDQKAPPQQPPAQTV